MTQQAEAAKAIRKELKASFPSVKFSIRSKSYSGGDSVSIDWTNGPTTEQVDKIAGKYQYGHFNGMEDIYEYSNNRKDIPQTKFVQLQRDIDASLYDEIKTKIAGHFGIDKDDENQWYDKFQAWSNTVVYRETRKMSLI